MRLSSKTAIITSAGVILLGTSLALSSAGVVSGASSTTCNDSSGFCLTESNTSTGTGSHGAINGTTKGTNATAIHGLGTGASSIGVDGASDGKTGFGVAGVDSNGGVGVYGKGGGHAKSGVGVEGVAGDAYSVGVAGYGGSGGPGVYGEVVGFGAIAGDFVDKSQYGTALVAEAVEGDPFDAYGASSSGSGTNRVFSVDSSGDGTFTGGVTASSFNTDVRSRGGENLGASVALTPQATMEDTGTARLLNGAGAVHFDPTFASTINANRGYQVFLTPNGDTRGLYVSAKYEGGFIVRENEHGRSSVYFDYRVVAHPYGASEARLPRLSIKRPTLPKLPKLQGPPLVTEAQP